MNGKLDEFSTDELQREIIRRQEEERRTGKEVSAKLARLSVEGTWSITTEGDCEGRTTKELGLYTGHFGDLALTFWRSAAYTLALHRPVPPEPLHAEGKERAEQAIVSVSEIIGYGGDNRITEAECRALEAWLGGGYSVAPGQFFRSVVIRRSLPSGGADGKEG